jgi:N-acetylglucosaminyldiphosphoundecaprenol N-acetyl-beta-D-mannosaminyltransferase
MQSRTQIEEIRAREVEEVCATYSPSALMRRKARRGLMGVLWKCALFISAWGKRVADILLAAILLAALSPLFLLVALVIRLTGNSVFVSEPRIGRWGDEFQMMTFNATGQFGRIVAALGIHRLPLLIHVLRGEMSLVGPRAVHPGELSPRARAVRKRSSVRPGLLSLWWLRKKANIDFGSELDVDLEYVEGQSGKGDLGIAIRSLPAMLYGDSSPIVPDQVEILGVPIRNITMEDALQFIMQGARGFPPQQVCFVNTDCVNKAQRNRPYAERLLSCSAVFADGIGIRVAGKILRRPIRQNVNGTDLFPRLCHRLQGSELGLFLLGARPGITEAVAQWVEKNHPGARVKGIQHGYFSPEEEPAVIRKINESGAEILLVAFGSPRQDMWIAEHLPELNVGIAMGVGGLFDFYSGQMPRAPQWLRELSLEWVYRLCQEPGRMWRRYLLGNLVFLSRVLISVANRRPAHSLNHRGH